LRHNATMGKKSIRRTPHVYEDGRVSLARVAAFADDTMDSQLRTLSILRARASNHWANTLGLLGIVFALEVGLGAALTPVLPQAARAKVSSDTPSLFGLRDDVIARLWLYVGGWLVLLVILATFALLAYRFTRETTRAQVLLAAYESELRRRESAPGRYWRKWRRAHDLR
jgi:hypothetical protein